jgi:hypothetical protein
MDARQRAKIALRSKRARPARMTGNPYRFSPQFIRRMTVILCIAIVVIPGAGIAYGLTLGSDYEPWQGAIATGLLIGGFGVPLLAAAVLGGEAIRRGGGFVGFLFAAGLIGGPTGSTLGIPWLAIAGYVALGVSVVLFFVIGFASKVPMWIGTPRAKMVSWNDPDDPNT